MALGAIGVFLADSFLIASLIGRYFAEPLNSKLRKALATPRPHTLPKRATL
ncbi:MAG: hypothetical protein LKI03_07580 [Acetobacter indonesiensis]|jgi:ethanolamine transporter EutH|nr:hypothetical protein [Acetobacter indonesiensis]MCI1546605.1 hypothetical protein [Acetobacter indonesiensis]MCI1765894.1 hypothetical protein [Acetobacter indonesiensis]